MKEEKGGGMSADERSLRGEQTDRYGNEVTGETGIRTFHSLPLCIYPSKKKRKVRPNKTFIIPGNLFNVFDIKRLKGGSEREMKRVEEGGKRGRQTEGRMCVMERMLVRGGGVAGLQEDKKSEAKVRKEVSER